MRNLSDECKTCNDNHFSMMMCIECCGVPTEILDKIENERKKDEWTIDQAIEYFSNKNLVLTEEEAKTNVIALNILRKYKKIEEIYDRWVRNNSYSYQNEMQIIGGILNDN